VYNSMFFDDVVFKTRWKPDMDYYSSMFALFADMSIADHGWYYQSKKTDRWKEEVSEDTFKYMWNTFKDEKIRTGLINMCIASNNDWCNLIINDLYKRIPVDFDEDSNILRARYILKLDSDYDYLSEVTKARIANQDHIVRVWERSGLANSKRASFYNFMWDSISRGKGSVEKRLEILKQSLKNEVYSEKILNHCAKRGTKRIKRLAVELLGDSLYSLRRYSNEDDEDALANFIEEKMLLFAGTDDASIVETLVEHISAKNLPWVMPSAANFPWLLRKINRKIERSKEDGF